MYGYIAIIAAFIVVQEGIAPKEAWKKAAKMVSDKNSIQEKACPMNIFLCLCSIGRIKNVKAGSYTTSKKTQQALDIELKIKENPKYTDKQIWDAVSSRAYNREVEVVRSLMAAGLI